MKHPVIQITFIIMLFIFTGCGSDGLKPVAGIEGKIYFNGVWPDSIKGALLVALDEGVASDTTNHPENYIITYGSAILPETETTPYFIQLSSGAYYFGILGILAEPSFFITKLDSFMTAPEFPIIQLTDPFEARFIPDDRTIKNIDWNINFTGETQ